MKSFAINFGLLASLVVLLACDEKTEKTAATDATPFVIYEGQIPCYDCAGIRISLAIDESSPMEERAYRLTETYLKSPLADSIYSRFGSYKVRRGNTSDSTALVFEIDTDLKHERYFVWLSEDTLLLADHNGNPILSPTPYYLIKTP